MAGNSRTGEGDEAAVLQHTGAAAPLAAAGQLHASCCALILAMTRKDSHNTSSLLTDAMLAMPSFVPSFVCKQVSEFCFGRNLLAALSKVLTNTMYVTPPSVGA